LTPPTPARLSANASPAAAGLPWPESLAVRVHVARGLGVLPRDTLVFPVSGIRPESMAPYWAAGASGFGTGSNLYRPGASADDVRGVAAAYAAAFRALPGR
jgi:2-dehydro-3-deoxyphosphogalactonate aldolase